MTDETTATPTPGGEQPATHHYPKTRRVDGVRTRYVKRPRLPRAKPVKHGLALWRRAWRLHGTRSLALFDDSTPWGSALCQLEAQVIAEQGGEARFGVGRRELLRRNLVRKLLLDSIAAWMLDSPSRVIDAKKKRVHPIVPAWDAMARSEAEAWKVIGIDAPVFTVTLDDILSESPDTEGGTEAA